MANRRSRFRLINETEYDTRQLKAFIIMVLIHEGVMHKPTDPFHVVVTSCRGPWISGRAYLNSKRIRMLLPTKRHLDSGAMDARRIQSFARVLIHEAGHCRGLEHREMLSSVAISTDFFNPEEWPITIKQQKQAAHPSPESLALKGDATRLLLVCPGCGFRLAGGKMGPKMKKAVEGKQAHRKPKGGTCGAALRVHEVENDGGFWRVRWWEGKPVKGAQ